MSNTEEYLKNYLLWINTQLRRYDLIFENPVHKKKNRLSTYYVRFLITRRIRSLKTAREVLLTGEDSAKNPTTGVENRREYSTPHSAALRRTVVVRRQASLYQRC